MQKNKPLKLIIDTNLWISFIISNKLKQLETLLFSGAVRPLRHCRSPRQQLSFIYINEGPQHQIKRWIGKTPPVAI